MDCISVVSKFVNLLRKKTFCGNIVLKMNVWKAFDTLDWQFIMNVLYAYGLNDQFYTWIMTILKSARLLFSINGKAVGFISCTRGVWQGVLRPPLIFCLAEEVLSGGSWNLWKSALFKASVDLRDSSCLFMISSQTTWWSSTEETSGLLLIFRPFFTTYGKSKDQPYQI